MSTKIQTRLDAVLFLHETLIHELANNITDEEARKIEKSAKAIAKKTGFDETTILYLLFFTSDEFDARIQAVKPRVLNLMFQRVAGIPALQDMASDWLFQRYIVALKNILNSEEAFEYLSASITL